MTLHRMQKGSFRTALSEQRLRSIRSEPFWPLFHSLARGNINSYITPRERMENWLKRARKSTNPGFKTASNKLKRSRRACLVASRQTSDREQILPNIV